MGTEDLGNSLHVAASVLPRQCRAQRDDRVREALPPLWPRPSSVGLRGGAHVCAERFAQTNQPLERPLEGARELRFTTIMQLDDLLHVRIQDRHRDDPSQQRRELREPGGVVALGGERRKTQTLSIENRECLVVDLHGAQCITRNRRGRIRASELRGPRLHGAAGDGSWAS